MLEAVSLVRSYGDFKAVDDVSFTIEQGQIIGLLGHNGAGKTTIMKMLSGHLEPDSGQILMDQTDISCDLLSFQQNLGYLPESLPVYPEMEVADFLDYVADLKGLAGSRKTSELKRVVEQTGIVEKLFSPISSLSRGYKQRVGVAQAVLGEPKLLILDEPTNGLDPSQTAQMRTLIRQVAKRATVILSTHIMQEVDALCDRVLILNQGRLAVDANLQELRESQELFLATDLGADVLADALDKSDKLQEWTEVAVDTQVPEGNTHGFSLKLKDSADRFEVGAAISKLVAEKGGKLYELRAVSRDLESLVREVGRTSSVEEVAHAA